MCVCVCVCVCVSGCICDNPQARVSYILRENTYPFLALVVLKQGRLIVCERVEGPISVQPLIARLQAAITNNEAELVVERNER